MNFNNVSTPLQLLHYLDDCFIYGVIDSDGTPYFDSNTEKFQNVCNTHWRTRSVEKILHDGIGHCYDQVEIERAWFQNHNYNFKTIWVVAYQKNIENSGFCHAYLVFEENSKWHIFEHADFENKGIHTFNSLCAAITWQADNQKKYASNIMPAAKNYSIIIKEYSAPPENLTMHEFLKFIDNLPDFKEKN